MRKATISLGRMNPFTRGHYRMVSEVVRISNETGTIPFVFIIDGLKSGMDKEKNPLSGEERKRIIRSLFPDVRVDVINSAFDVFDVLEVQGFEIDYLVAGSDRAANYEKMIANYSDFGKVFILDRDDEGFSGISGTAARKAASENDFYKFKNIMPDALDNDVINFVFRKIREGLNNGS